MTTKQELLAIQASQHYKYNVFDLDDVYEDLKTVNFIKRFFKKLHDNKLINVQLLVNHEIMLYNVFENNWITEYQLKTIPNVHKTYLRTILLYLNKITYEDVRFINIPFSFDLDYLLQTKSYKAI